ncbi:cytochrome P450 [Saccharothrix obliqua]|uniref:cytochrome P450 n=1 Tax=Saccharothrix obliqua TaxID=2861747 RepID=UPI001C5F32E6|nr:cytochrome P450 [Saccharothrix obliqua]MBW4721813.1 cytochrome P450 [Saccharothrix obliqua]
MTTARRAVSPPTTPLRAAPGLLRQLIFDRLGMMRSAAEAYGDAVKITIGPKSLYFFNHPDHAKHVLADNPANYRKGIGYIQARRALGDGLLTSDGERWREQRRVVQPAFAHKRIAARADVVAREAGALVARLRGAAGPVNLVDELTGFTLAVLGHTLLDTDLDAFTGAGRAFGVVQDQAMFEMETMGLVPTWVPLAGQLRFRRARRYLDDVVARLTADRLRHPRPEGDDVLTRLIAATRNNDPRRLRDDLVTLLLAGHETTASTLGWTWYLLDRHPDVLRRVREEAVDVLGDRLPTFADLPRLTYTAAVLNESMRLYPPVWILTRQAKEDDDVAGYRVPAGSDVLICPYTLHRHPGLWDEPDRFDPDRFLPDRSGGRPRYAYLPFGAGPRFCVGQQLGLVEATFATALLARDLRLRTAAGHRAVPEPMLSLRMRGGLPVTVHPA